VRAEPAVAPVRAPPAVPCRAMLRQKSQTSQPIIPNWYRRAPTDLRPRRHTDPNHASSNYYSIVVLNRRAPARDLDPHSLILRRGRPRTPPGHASVAAMSRYVSQMYGRCASSVHLNGPMRAPTVMAATRKVRTSGPNYVNVVGTSMLGGCSCPYNPPVGWRAAAELGGLLGHFGDFTARAPDCFWNGPAFRGSGPGACVGIDLPAHDRAGLTHRTPTVSPSRS